MIRYRLVLLLLPVLALPGAAARAQPAASPDVARLQAEVTRLENEVREQRQLLLQLMQVDEERFSMLLKLLQGRGDAPRAAALPTMPSMPSVPAAPAAPAAEARASGGGSGTITGKVRFSGNSLPEAWVYVEGAHGGARPQTLEIKQQEKQFSPQIAVVPVGSRVIFPNLDSVFHNVFSTTPGNAFDLGSVRAGEKPKAVVMSKPGHVEVFCNIHAKMRADLLIVPSGYFARVDPDGSFTLRNVPAGSRRVVLWSPALRPTQQRVDVTDRGASVTLNAEPAPVRPHMNKLGQAYGSYGE